VTGESVARGPKLRAAPSAELYAALVERYGIGDGPRTADRATDIGGSSNLNLLVAGGRQADRPESAATGQDVADGPDRWVVRVYRPWVTSERLDAIQRARRALADGGVPCALPRPTKDGAAWITVEDRLVEVEPYVPHDAEMDSWERLRDGLPLLGRIHAVLERLQLAEAGRTAPASNSLSPEDLLGGVRLGTQRIREWPPTEAERRIADTADALVTLVSDAERGALSPNPPPPQPFRASGTEQPQPSTRDDPWRRQIVHGDFWDNNVLFRAGGIVQIADLDFMGERARIDDLALTLYYTNSTFKDDQTSPQRAGALRMLVDAYDSGLRASGADPLSDAERAALPVAIARTALAFIAMIPSVDSEAGARKLAAEMARDLEWATAIMRDIERWQGAFVGQ
jgi:Ser/Thr protein kinase RdoA (MazF antagonist)